MSNLRTTVLIGAHRVLWTPDGGSEVDLGFTEEGVEIEIEQSSKYERTVHESAILFDARTDEISITAEVILKEASLDTVATALGAVKTDVTGPPAKECVSINPARGAQASFGKLVFRPRSKAGVGGTDKSKDKTIYNAIVMGDSTRPFKANADATVTLSVKAGLHYDSVKDKYFLYCEGDPSADPGFDI